jgi:hypothetical protein
MNYVAQNRLLRYVGEYGATRDPIEEKIRSFGDLPTGWDFGQGEPPSAATIEKAIEIYRFGRSLDLDSEIFPGTNGEIAIAFYREDRSVEFIIDANQSLSYHIEEGQGFDYRRIECVEEASFEVARERLIELSRGTQCNTFGSLTLGILAFAEGGFPMLGSRTQHDLILTTSTGLGVFQYSRPAALVTI